MTPRFNLLAFAFLAALTGLATLAGWLNRKLRIVEDYPERSDLP